MSKIFHAGNLIIVGFIISALSMLFLAYKTTQVKFDLSTQDDPYSKEVEFNQQLIAQQHSKKLGDAFSIHPDTEYITVNIPVDVSRKITKGIVEFYCYSNSELDMSVLLSSSSEGVYTFARSEYMKGHNYKVKVSFTAGGEDYYKELKVY